MSFRPTDINNIGNFYIDGIVNGEKFNEAEFEDPVEAFEVFHNPIYDGIETPKRFSNAGYGEKGEINKEYEELMGTWRKNREADFYFYIEDVEGEEMKWYLNPRTDIEFSDTCKPFSMMEAKYTPDQASEFRRPQKLVMRIARRYEDEAFENAGINPEIGQLIPEIDLLTAFDRDNGVQEKMWESDIDWRRPVRYHYQVIDSDYKSDWEKASESVPIMMNFLPNDLESVGISKQERELSALHIASCHGLNLSFRNEREKEELMIEFGKNQENLVNIDAEFGRYFTDEDDYSPFSEDLELYRQQIINIAGSNWREIDARIEEKYEEFSRKVKKSEQEWDKLLDESIPANWSKELPENRIV